MPLKEGEVYRCPDPNCGCEITVTKGAPSDCKGNEKPCCCCGKTMEKYQAKAPAQKRRTMTVADSSEK